MVMLHMKLKGITNAVTVMVANILPTNPPTTPRLPYPPHTLAMRSIGQHSSFSEHGHVAYQIKWNHEM